MAGRIGCGEAAVNAFDLTLWFIALATMVAGAVIDLKDRIIPDLLVVVVLVAGIALRIAHHDIGYGTLVAAILYGAVLYLHRRDLIGGGDAKLIVASSLLVPPAAVATLLIRIVVAGGVLAGIYLLARLAVARSSVACVHARGGVQGVFAREIARIGGREPMPYAFAILGGAAFTFYDKVVSCSSAIPCSH
jgi:Flp pilus assembly protein protease CpaA